jgi:hypothetical protein
MGEDHVVAVLLLALLALVASLGLLMAALAIRWRRRDAWLERRVSPAEGPEDSSSADTFRRADHCPVTWLAARTTDLKAVQRAFALDNPQPCAWTEGLTTEAVGHLFVSPPVAGWVLVTGAELPDPAVDIDACFRFLLGLSGKLGHVQCFHCDRVSGHHGWARLDGSRVLRGRLHGLEPRKAFVCGGRNTPANLPIRGVESRFGR